MNDPSNSSENPANSAALRRRLEEVLLEHAGVRDAALLEGPGDERVALVVADDDYLDEVLGRAAAQAATIARWQKTYDLNQSTQAAMAAPSGFNTLGWDSTYTRQPLPDDEMREWIQTSVDDILQLRPQSLLEIGCGTGLLLTRIAPHCERYVAMDFSRAVVDRLRQQLATLPSIAERVEILERRADNLDGLAPQSFDTLVINSAAQYFPNLAYLTRVLENAVALVKDGGHLFIGDVRSLPLLPAFAASVELFQAQDEVALAELQERANKRLRLTPELVLSPACFLALQQRLPRLSRVDIQPRPGRADNEMTRYRYNAFLHVGSAEEPVDLVFEDWSENEFCLEGIRARLRTSVAPLGIAGIPNARLEGDLLALRSLTAPDPHSTAADLRRNLRQRASHGIHPQDLFDLVTQTGYQAHLSWAASRPDGSYDAAFIPAAVSDAARVGWPHPHLSAFLHLANAPGQSKFCAELMERLRGHLRDRLGASATPVRIILVDSIPRLPDGTVGANLSDLNFE